MNLQGNLVNGSLIGFECLAGCNLTFYFMLQRFYFMQSGSYISHAYALFFQVQAYANYTET